MAKPPVKRPKRTASATAEFRTGMPNLIRDMWLSAATRLASLLEEDRASQLEDIVAAHMAKNGLDELPPAYDQPFLGYIKFADVVSAAASRMIGTLASKSSKFEQYLQMLQSSDPAVFKFRLGNPNLNMVFGPTTIPGAEVAFRAKEPFAPLIRMFKEVGLDLNSGSPMSAVFVPAGYEQGAYQRGVTIDGASILGYAPNEKSVSILKSGIVTAKVDFNVVITDNAMTITPYVDFEVDRTLYDTIVEYEGTKQEPLYIYMWMSQATHAASSAVNSNRWKGSSVIDLRIVTKKLNTVKQEFGLAAARVNKDGFAIGGDGMPMFVPDINRGAEYVATISKSTKINQKGMFDFAESHLQWANQIVMVDWFNDYILYADQLGHIKEQRMLGVRKLDPASEMMFLNTPINATPSMVTLMQNIQRLAEANITADEAAAFMTPETKAYFSDTVPSFSNALGQMQLVNVDRERERSSFTNSKVAALKHIFGFDTDDLRDNRDPAKLAGYADVVRAYLRALYRQRNKLDIPIFTRLNGFEYVTFAAEKYSTQEKWQAAVTANAKETQEMNATFAFPDSIELPNLTISDSNINALMPHQVRYLGAMRDGVKAGAAGIATGGGKGVMGPLDIIQQMALGRVKRPLIATKPGLVRENISEINRISGGKINVVPLRTRNIRHLKRKAGLKTAKDFLAWARNLPSNTIFVCAYSDFASRSKPFPDLDVPARALWYDVQLSQMVHLLRLIGIDMVYGDESHLIKKLTSKRSICAQSVFAGADQTRIASGTFVNNVPKDYVGQYFALNPTIFGNNIDTFEDVYNIRGGQLRSDDDARRLKFRRSELSRSFEADESDWAFVLPIFKDKIEYFTLTPLQEEFYNILLQEALLQMKAELEAQGKGKKKKPVAVKEDDDDEADDEDDEEDLDPDDFEDEDAYIMAKAQASLAKVDQFLIAPDANDQYVNWVKAPKGEDLVSPAVRKLDADLDKHFAAIPKDRWATEKVLVFSVNKVASVHIYKYSKWAGKGLRYMAGQQEQVRRFKTENDIVVLFADETSLREGENLQMCSMMCRMQPVWTPGDYKQAAARAYRPDPRGVFADRTDVKHVWYIAEGARSRPTVSSVKLAAMISKSINNARERYEDDPAWRKVSPQFDDLKKLRMNLQIIFNTEPDDVAPYMRKWDLYTTWVADQVQRAKVREAENLEREHNVDLIKDGKIIDVKAFLKLAMRPLTSKTMLPGSKRVYTPWEWGAIPADIYNLGLGVLGGQEITVGTPVMTEFGAAVVVKNDGIATLKVELYGGKTVTLRRLAVAVPNNDAGKRKLKAIISSKADWKATYASPRISAAGVSTKIGERTTTDEPKTTVKPIVKQKTPAADGDEQVDIFTQIINGWPFLAVDAAEAPDALTKARGWTRVEPYIAVTFKSWQQADKFLDVLADKFFMTQPKFDKLVGELTTLQTGRAMRLTQRVKEAEVRSFFLTQHKMKGKAKDGRYIIDPFFVAFDDMVYLVFDRKTHSPSVLNWLNRAVTATAGMRKSKPNEGFIVYPFKTMAEATEGIKAAAKYLQFDEMQLRDEIDEMKEDLKQFAVKKVTPRAGTRR